MKAGVEELMKSEYRGGEEEVWKTWFVQSLQKAQTNGREQIVLYLQYSNCDCQYFKNTFIALNLAMPSTAEVTNVVLGSCLMEGVCCSLSQFSPIEKHIYFKNTFSTGILSGMASALGEHECWSHSQPVGKILKENICLLPAIWISLNGQNSRKLWTVKVQAY